MGKAPKPQASFVTSAPDLTKLPDHDINEIALAGRSNVGKSSLLGMLLGSASLVRTSRTPGRTQLLNVFAYGDALLYVDLPGYGYAKLSLAERAKMSNMVNGYLTRRTQLRGVLLLLDARRDEVSDLDRRIAEQTTQAGKQILLVATKSDLLPKNVRLSAIRKLEKSFGVPAGMTVVCSSKTGDGRNELLARIKELGG